MKLSPNRGLIATGASLLVLLVAACGGGSSSSSSGGTTIKVALTDNGCSPSSISASAGPTTIQVSNKSSSAVTEFEIMDGDKIIGEVENVAPGLTKELSIRLKAGNFDTSCPGGKNAKGKLTVTGIATLSAAQEEANKKATDIYRSYVSLQADVLTTATKAFTDAVIAGDIAKAKSLYPAARLPYERIEPVAESFGDLDPSIDAREDDSLPDGMTWGGFHRLEKALWSENSLTGMTPVAQRLLKDVTDLKNLIPTADFDAAQIADGAVELLNEVSSKKITGEEERYSHLDLLDFSANVEGAQQAFLAVQPLLQAKDKDLDAQITKRFTDVITALNAYKTGDTYKDYTQLSKDDTKKLASAVDALAEPLSKVAKDVVE